MNKWKVTYYSQDVYQQLLKWPKKLRAKYTRIAEMMEQLGPDLGMPYTKPFGEGLFEVRAKAQEGIARAFFCIQVDQEIVILHGFIKKTQQTPNKELKIARKRLAEVKKNGKINT